MSEYIEREALLDLLADIDRCGYLDGGDINSIPAADVVEVVRCKDCINCDAHLKKNGEVYFYKCDFFDIEIEPDDFCSYGERRETNGH